MWWYPLVWPSAPVHFLSVGRRLVPFNRPSPSLPLSTQVLSHGSCSPTSLCLPGLVGFSLPFLCASLWAVAHRFA
jgi:hypothetical protein